LKHKLPNGGNKIDYSIPWDGREFNALQSKLMLADRLLRQRNINPELNKLLGSLFNSKAIRDGRLQFNAEIPGFNSNRAFLGMRYNL